MKIFLAVLAALALTLLAVRHVRSQTPPTATSQSAATQREMFVAPSSASVDLGRAALTVSPLAQKGKYYVGTYQIKVTPYAFKNETGTLVLGNGENLFGKLAAGTSLPFSGKATSGKDGQVKVVNGTATPAGNDHGAVNFTVVTENGPLTFKTSYRLGQ